MPILRAFREPADDAGDKPVEAGQGVPLYFTAATGGRKQDGIDLSGIPWDFSRAVKSDAGGDQYPLLWVHDMTQPPLGVVDVIPGDKPLPLRVALRFDPDDARAVEIERKYRSPVGGMQAVSVQWAPVDKSGMIVRGDAKPAANQLWEVSAVPVGMDEGALQDGARAATMRAMIADLTAMLDGRTVEAAETVTETTETIDVDLVVTVETDDGDNVPDTVEDEATPERLAASMVAIFEPHRWADDSDTERRAAYKALLPRYRRAGWTAPEFVPMVELAALDEAALRGLFLAGELARVGAELSTKNVAELRDIDTALRDASKRLGAMLSRVTSAKERPSDDDAGDDTARAAGGDTVDDLVAAFARLTNKETHNG